MVETYGIGALIPNTVLLGNSNASFNQDWESHKQYCQTIAQLHQLKRNIIILKENSDRQSRTFGEHKFGNYQRIDIWWSGIQANGSFMLLLAYLLKNDWQWRKANIFVKLVIKNPHASETTQSNLSNLIEKLNIDVIPQVIVSEETSFEKNLAPIFR